MKGGWHDWTESTLVAAVLLALAAGGACADGSTETVSDRGMKGGGSEERNRVPGEYIVTLRPGSGEAELRSAFAPYAVASVKDLGNRLWLLKLDRDPGPQAMETAGRSMSAIEHVQPNFAYRPFRR